MKLQQRRASAALKNFFAAKIDEFFDQLADQELISAEINRLFAKEPV